MGYVRTLQVGEVALLVELCALETEGVDNVVDLDGGVLKSLLTLLGGGVGTNVYENRNPDQYCLSDPNA